jgi:hypothetical protein
MDIITDEFVSFKYSLRYRPGFSYYKIHWYVSIYPDDRGGHPTGAEGYARSIKQAVKKVCRAVANWEVGAVE